VARGSSPQVAAEAASPARGLLLLEVELVAPVKFFGLFPEQCARYAEAVVSRAPDISASAPG